MLLTSDTLSSISHQENLLQKNQTMLEILSLSKRFETFVELIKMAQLTEILSKKGEYTLFALSNIAFEQLPKGTMEALRKPENREMLQQILRAYIVQGRATVFEITLEASNGIIHVIDKVFIPPTIRCQLTNQIQNIIT